MHQQSRNSVSNHKCDNFQHNTIILNKYNTIGTQIQHNLNTNTTKSVKTSKKAWAWQHRSNGSMPADCQGKQRLALFHTPVVLLLHTYYTATLLHSYNAILGHFRGLHCFTPCQLHCPLHRYTATQLHCSTWSQFTALECTCIYFWPAKYVLTCICIDLANKLWFEQANAGVWNDKTCCI